MNKNKSPSPIDRSAMKPSIRTNIRAGGEVFICTVTVTNGKAGPVTCEKLGEIK